MEWKKLYRPGYFGRRRDEKITALNKEFGTGNWRLVWIIDPSIAKDKPLAMEFEQACRLMYEMSYSLFLDDNPDIVDFICSHREVIDNAETNIQSGFNYNIQEAFSTHIQDIAIRNCLRELGRWFDPNGKELLTVRGPDSNGGHLNPGHIPFYSPVLIEKPSLAPKWAAPNSVEDFWQSNKWIQVRE